MLKVDLDDVELDRAGFLKKSQVTMPVFSRMLEASMPRVWGPREGLREKGSGRQSSRPNEGGRPRREDPGLSELANKEAAARGVARAELREHARTSLRTLLSPLELHLRVTNKLLLEG